jgi:hypothetical protein
MFVYPKAGSIVYAGSNEKLWRERRAKLSLVPPQTRPEPKMPALKVNGVYVHDGECECDWCVP